MVQIKPLGKRILLKRSSAQQTKGGILLPETAQEKPKRGTVIAVGSSEEGVKVGDEVYFAAYAGSEVSMNNEEGYLILPMDEVLCVVES
ncbi:MAG: 10 kDa chaperonin [Chlamydiae bacterium]|nr:10 kDa chaperonin [Chlamydiota bacterium]